MQYTEQELQELIKNVEHAFMADLQKAEDEHKEKAKEEAPEHKEAPPKEAAQEAKPAPEHEQAQPAQQEAMPSQGQEEQCDYDNEDMEHMHKMYMSMNKAELKVHHDAIRQAMDGITAAPPGNLPAQAPDSKEQDGQSKEIIAKSDGNGGEMSQQAPGKTPGAKAPATKETDKMSKTETGKIEASAPGHTPGAKSPASAANGAKVMEKSENSAEYELLKSEVESQKSKADGLQKSLDAVSEFLTKLVQKTSAPQGKAITSYDAIAKSEGSAPEEQTLTKSEITARLNKKAADPSLSQNDRSAINDFYFNETSINSISHLLK